MMMMKNVKDWDALKLTRSDLEEIRTVMAQRIREGLSSDEGEIKALPTYLPPPRAPTTGEAVVIDIGGTNVRVAEVRLSETGQYIITRGPSSYPLSPAWESADAFFESQARLALSLNPDPHLPVGYCFSYPATATPEKDAILLQWTKELEVPDVVGHRVGEMLMTAFRKNGFKGERVTVLNDTVAALSGGSWAYGSNPRFSDFIGLIVGTGTNMAAYFPTRLISPKKFAGSVYRFARMAVNLESGNFHPPHLSRFDDELDALRLDRGRQRLEKAVSGKFIPEIFKFLLNGRIDPPFPETRAINRMARQSPRTAEGALALSLMNRSADLVAASLAGLIEILKPEGEIGILSEGGVINSDPAYQSRVDKQLAALRGDSFRFSFLHLDNVNLVGAAAAALL